MAVDYCSLADVKAVMPNAGYGTSYDELIANLITRASRMVDKHTNREDGAYYAGTSGSARYFDGSGTVDLLVDEMASVPSAVEVDEIGDHTYTAWETTDYIVEPYNKPPYWKLEIDIMAGSKATWYAYRRGVKITACWGYSVDVPNDIKQVTIILVMRAFQRGKQGFEDAGAITELGQLRYVKAVDPDVAFILQNYVRIAV